MQKYSSSWVVSTTYTNSNRFLNNTQMLNNTIDDMKKQIINGEPIDMNMELKKMNNLFEEDPFDKLESEFEEKFKNTMWDELQKVKNSPKKKSEEIKTIEPTDGIPTSKTKQSKETKKEIPMNQFLTLDIGSNKATIDLSKVRKQGLLFEKSMFGKKPKIVIYYLDRPETPEVNFELNSEDEARKVYDKINKRLEEWADASNSAKIARLEKELEVMHEQKQAMIEEKEVLMDVFNSFKEMMQIMEDDKKTSTLVSTIKDL